MRNYLLFIVYWLACLPTTFAQLGWPPIYSFNTDSTFFRLDTTHFQVLQDVTGTLTLEQVQKSKAFRYEAYYDSSRQSHVYWMRMRLRNNLRHSLNLYLCDFDNDYIDIYWRDSTQQWQHQRIGALIPKSQLPAHKGNKERNRLFFHLSSGQEMTLYQRSENTFWHSPVTYLAPQFQTEEGRQVSLYQYIVGKDGWQDYWSDGIVIGLLLLAVGYNLLIFFSTKEKVYLYFGICLLFFVLDRNIDRAQQAFFDEYPYPFKLVANLFFIVFFSFFVQSVRQFIQPATTLPRLNRATTLALAITALLNLVYIVTSKYPILTETSIRVVYALCLLMTYRMRKKGVVDARFVLIAIAPLFTWWLFTLAGNTARAYYQVNLFPDFPRFLFYAESVCLGWMIVFFTGALINRYNLTRRQVAQQAIEKEQLEKEREIERNRLIATQNERLEQQVKERTAELQQSLETLKATQNQLIQKEKLASLGELTAGIAHEIQNPLNFVNNFSEVSIELIDELREEQQKAERDEGLEDEIVTDLQQNLRKINQHGQRAGAIVRGMLEHSRVSTGEKQPADLNALADEYLRLSYHGLRAKDKAFNCQLITDFDAALPRVSVVAQDIGRVMLNLYNNAFYAVQEKQRNLSDGTSIYQPMVWVTTCFTTPPGSTSQWAEIRVRDNGTGIIDTIRQKIFQPFFSTKPTGQGTGLGLSLSYDIITKGHSGDLTVESREDEGTEFIIRLPI